MKKIFVLACFCFSVFTVFSQSGNQAFTTSGVFVVPSGITSITVEAFGAGGNGGGNGGGGGGGGGYASGTFTVVPGASMSVQVGVNGNGSLSGIGSLGITASGGGNGTSVSNPNIGGGGAGGTGTGGTLNRTGGTGGGGYWTYFGGGGGGCAGSVSNGTDGGNTIPWTGNCITPGGTGGASGGAPAGAGGKGAGFTDANCNVPDPAVAGANYGGGGGGGNGNGGAAQPGSPGYVYISWLGCAPPAAPTGNATQIFCNAATVANLVATGTGIQWYGTPSGGSPLAGTIPLIDALHYYATQTISGCESSTRLDVGVTINSTNPPTGNATQTKCQGATISDLTATGTGIQWYFSPNGGSPLPGTTLLVNGTHYFASQTVANCESQTRVDVTVTITVVDVTTSLNQVTIFANASLATFQWIDCNNGNQIIPGATSQSFTATQNGNYAVIVTQNTCRDTSACVAVTTVEIEPNLHSGNIILFPNPASHQITVFYEGFVNDRSFSISDLNGKTVISGKIKSEKTMIDISELSTGVYHFRSGESDKQVFKVVKE